MANHLNLCLVLLVVTARNTLSNPVISTVAVPTIPPLDGVLDDVAANPPPAVDIDGNPISCSNDDDCYKSVLGPDSRCAGHFCECKIGAIPSITSKKCLGAVHTLGSGCEETWQCTRELGNEVECKNHLCVCVQGSEVVDGKCTKQIPLSGQCKSNEECVGGRDTTCTDGICVCTLDKVPSPQNDRCLPIATKFEDQCEEYIQCSTAFGDGAKCYENKCICSDDHHYSNNACLRNLNLDEPCVSTDGDCFLKSTGIERVTCNVTCQCKYPYHPSSDKTECLSEGQPVDVNGNPILCTSDDDCYKSVLGPDSHCAGHFCKCKIGVIQSNSSKKCLGAVHNLGAGCEETWQCTRELGNQVECKNYLCTCVEGSEVVDGKCTKQIPLSGQCESNEECVGGRDTTCTDGICVCTLDKVPSPQNDRCLPIATKFEDQCEESIQCSSSFGDGSKCTDNKCICSDDHHFINKKCLRNLNLDEPCVSTDGDCFLKSTGIERVTCNVTCQCKYPYHPSSDKTECLSEGQPERGDAASLKPIFAVLVSIMIARIVAS